MVLHADHHYGSAIGQKPSLMSSVSATTWDSTNDRSLSTKSTKSTKTRKSAAKGPGARKSPFKTSRAEAQREREEAEALVQEAGRAARDGPRHPRARRRAGQEDTRRTRVVARAGYNLGSQRALVGCCEWATTHFRRHHSPKAFADRVGTRGPRRKVALIDPRKSLCSPYQPPLFSLTSY